MKKFKFLPYLYVICALFMSIMFFVMFLISGEVLLVVAGLLMAVIDLMFVSTL